MNTTQCSKAQAIEAIGFDCKNEKMSEDNIGEMLYKKGVYAKEMKNNELAKKKKDLENEELQQCTFKPSIHQSDVSSRYNNFNSRQYFTKKEEKLQVLRDRLYYEENKSNTFIPKINRNYSSEKLFKGNKTLSALQSTDKINISKYSNNPYINTYNSRLLS